MLSLLALACAVDPPPPARIDAPNDPAVDTAEPVPGDTSPEDSGGVSNGDTGDDPLAEVAEAEAFYAFGILQELRLTLTEDTIKELDRQARRGTTEYLPGDVEVNGIPFGNVGVRIKGSSTLRTFDGKPSLKIKFNAFVPDQDFAGLERVTLNNMVEDPTQTKEVMAYRIFREAGLDASRANHAAVYVNDELYGLYTNLETMDDHWLGDRFPDPAGELFEANDNADFTRGGLAHWESASGEGDTTQLQAVIDALRVSGGDFEAELSGTVDLAQFRRFWAWSLLIGNTDGYPYTLNDCYVYADPGAGLRFVFFPWGVDESWQAWTLSSWGSASGVLAARCLDDDACRSSFRATMTDELALYETFPVVAWFTEAEAATADILEADPRRSFTLAGVRAERANLVTALEGWAAMVREAMGL
ncbi:MAG: hypothetical protein EXR71_08715 [Myxococcales bacterium]|nr:hypothetical protein [Myxococcales bacterium]